MATEHNVITDPEIHEPKVVSTANSGQVYVANGAGSGALAEIEDLRTTALAGSTFISDGSNGLVAERVHGWGQFQDTAQTSSPATQTLANGVRTKWLCDGGDLTLEKSPSDLVNPLWDVVNNKHVPIAAFDTYTLRITCTVEGYAGTDPHLDLELDIGGSIGVISATTVSLVKSSATQKISWVVPVFTGTTYLANGGTIYAIYSGTGSIDMYMNSIFIRRETKDYT